MNRKGFTLTELLVVIIIIGIIIIFTFPLIRSLTSNLENRKYDDYRDSIISASKLYNDSYSEDLFGHKEYGCAYIKYSDLVRANLIKDIAIDDVSCNSKYTYVKVIKQKDKYGYYSYLACGKKVNGKAHGIDKSIPSVIPEIDENSCTGVNDNNLSITADLTMSDSKISGNPFNKKRKTTSLVITSGTGISSKVVIYATWKNDNNFDNATDWKKVDFKVKGRQEEELSKGNSISTKSGELITPEGYDGKYYLLVRVDNLQDLYGSKWKNPDGTNSKYISFGPFSVDNVKPTITNLSINSTNTNYNTAKVNVVFDGNDNHSSQSELKMCITESSAGCSNYVNYNKTSQYKFNISGSATKTLYVYLKDKAGNIKKETKNYIIQGLVTVYDKICNEDGGSCTNYTPDPRYIAKKYGTTNYSIAPLDISDYTTPSSYEVDFNGSSTLIFNHTRDLTYENFGNRGNRFTGYSISTDDSGITVKYSGSEDQIRLWSTGYGVGEEPSNYFNNGARFSYSEVKDASGPTHNKEKGSYFVISDSLSFEDGNNLELRPIIRVLYYDGDTKLNLSSKDDYKKPHTSLDVRGYSKKGYTLKAWRLQSYYNTRTKTSTWDWCEQLQDNNWVNKVYYLPNKTINKESWNLSNGSYPCPTHYGYYSDSEYITIRFKTVWRKDYWVTYNGRVVNGVAP